MAALTRGWISAALAAALVLASPMAARAHAGLASSAPAAGDTVAAAPRRLLLRFTEPVEAAQSGLVLLTWDGRAVTLVPGRDPEDVAALEASLPALEPGGYRVQWRTLSADGHPVDGSFVFYVGGSGATLAPAPAERAMEEPVSPALLSLAAVLRGLGVGALAALCGLLIFATRDPSTEDRTGRLALALACAAALLLAAHALAWAAYARGTHGGAPLRHLLLETGPGHLELARAALALFALWALALARRPGLALGFAAAAVAASGFTGHAAAIHPALSAPAKAIHVAAVAVWLGGLAALFATLKRDDDPRGPSPLLPAVREKGPGDEGHALALRVSSLSLAAVVALAASGVLQALLFAPLGLLARSAYGAVLLAKLVGMAVLVAIGARNRYRLVPRLPEAGARAALRRSVGWELAVMSLVLLAAGLLAYLPVPRSDPPTHTTHAETN
ncbi:MAG: copper resistance protein CopC [Longimicrobiaceae bacterium]